MIVDQYNINDLVTLRVRRRRRTWADSVLDSTFAHYRVEPTTDEVDVDVAVGSFEPDLAGTLSVDGRYWVAPGRIVYDSRLKVGRWRTEIDGLEGDRLRVRIASNTPARMVFPGETIYSLLRLVLARRGHLLLHGPAVTWSGRALLLAARSGAGKTITAVNFARRGWGFMGDDSTILADDGVRSFIVPFNLRFTYDVQRLLGIRFSRRKRLEIFMKRCLSVATLGRINLFSQIAPAEVFGGRIVDAAPLDAVYLLLQGAETAVSEPWPVEPFAEAVFINTRFEADELQAMLLAYRYGNPGSPLAALWDEARTALHRRLADCVCRRITVPDRYTAEVFETIRTQAETDVAGKTPS
ncbi:MAG: hypothetical protein R6X20_07175 [Phycisphaerae bacterium]